MDKSIEYRKQAFEEALVLVQKVVSIYGVQEYSRGEGFEALTMTETDQVINHIITIADWLLGEN